MNNEEMNFLDRFLYKLLIGSFLLMCVAFLDKIKLVDIDNIQSSIGQHYNILKIVKAVNGEKGVLLPFELTDEVSTTVMQPYLDSVKLSNGKRKVIIEEFSGVEIYKTGVVVKIFQNSDQTFNVTVKGIDDLEYVYEKLESVDCNIYKIVSCGDILGSPSTKDDENYFEFYVKDKNQIIDIIP